MCIVSGKPSNVPVGRTIAGRCTVHVFCQTLARALLPFACFGHVSVTELGQGQKAAVLVKVVKPQNKEMEKSKHNDNP